MQIAGGIHMSQLEFRGAAQGSVGRAADTAGLLAAEGPCSPSHWSRTGLDAWLHSTERPGLCLQVPGRAEPIAASCDPPSACSWLLGTLGKPGLYFCAMTPWPYPGPLLRHLSWCIPGDPSGPTAVFSSTLIMPETALIPAFGGRSCSGHAQHCSISVPPGEPRQHFYLWCLLFPPLLAFLQG